MLAVTAGLLSQPVLSAVVRHDTCSVEKSTFHSGQQDGCAAGFSQWQKGWERQEISASPAYCHDGAEKDGCFSFELTAEKHLIETRILIDAVSTGFCWC